MPTKKKTPILPLGGIVSPTAPDSPTGETVLTSEMQEALAAVIKPAAVPRVPTANGHTPPFTIPKPHTLPDVCIDPSLPDSHPRPTPMEILEARRIARRTEPLEQNHPVMEFLEDIIYCPTQIEFYFRTDGQVMSLYIRQRHGETTAQLVPCYPNGEPQWDSPWPHIQLSRPYDIEGRHRQSAEAEEQEIIAIERDCLTRLRTMFPDVPFPQHPNRRRGRYAQRLSDVRL